MPQIITCPDCERKLRVPEKLLGKKVRCPGCSVLFKAPAGDTGAEDQLEEADEEPSVRRRPATREERISDSPRSRRRIDEDDEEDDEEEALSRRDEKARWKKVRLGIHLERLGILIFLGSVALSVVLALLSFLAAMARAGNLSMALGILMNASMLLGNLAEWILCLIGYGMCMFAPPKPNSGVRPLGVTAFGLLAVSVLLVLLVCLIAVLSLSSLSLRALSGFGIVGVLLMLLSGLCVASSFIVHLFFLRGVCHRVRARHLAGQPISILIAFISYWIAFVLIYGFLMLILRSLGFAGIYVMAVVMLLLGLTYLGLTIWYTMVLRDIRDAVASYRRRL